MQHYTACVSSLHVARALAGDAVVYVAMRDKLDLLCKFNFVGIDAGMTWYGMHVLLDSVSEAVFYMCRRSDYSICIHAPRLMAISRSHRN